MKSITSSLMLAVVCTAVVAKAGVFEERRSLNIRNSYQSQELKYWRMIQASNQTSVKAIRIFAESHSGFATEPVCEYVQAKCDHGFCAGNIMSNEIPSMPLSQVQTNAGYYLVGCKMELRNGLACKVEFPNSDIKALEGVCYDARGNEKEFSVSKSSLSK